MMIWSTPLINIGKPRVLRYAKTLYKPQRPSHINDLIAQYTKSKLPNFFIYAKDKKKSQVEPVNNSTVNRLGKIVKNKTISMQKAGLGDFDYKMLMKNQDFELDMCEDSLDSQIIELYKKLDRNKKFLIVDNSDDSKKLSSFDDSIVYKNIRDRIIQLGNNQDYIVDVLVKYLFDIKDAKHKLTLWHSFGDIIVRNIQNNLVFKSITYCESCGDVIEVGGNRAKYCGVCKVEKEKERQRKKWHKNKEKYKKLPI